MKKIHSWIAFIAVIFICFSPVSLLINSVSSYTSPDASTELDDISDTVNTEGFAYDSSMHVDSNGIAHLAWREEIIEGVENDMFYYNSQTDITRNISDPAIADEDVDVQGSMRKLFVADSGRAYVLWYEANTSTPSWGELFLYDNQTNTTYNLTNSIIPGGIRGLKADLDDNSILHVAWIQNTASYGYDSFYYNTNTRTTLNISDHSNSNGDVESILITAGSNSASVVWYEETATMEGSDLFYYNSIDNTTLLITDRTQSHGPIWMFRMTVDNNNIYHVAWSEYDNTTNELTDIYYYNSDIDTTRLISDRTDTEGDAFLGVFPIKYAGAEGVYITWVEEKDAWGEGTDAYIYNSESDTTNDISYLSDSQGNVNRAPMLKVNSDGDVYAIWSERNDRPIPYSDLYYYNQSTDTTSLVSDRATTYGDVSSVYNAKLDHNGNLHIAFSQDNNVLGEEYDMYYFNSLTGTTNCISDHSLSEGNLNITKLEVKIDDLNNAHISWFEDSGIGSEGFDTFYFNTISNTTQLLTNRTETTGYTFLTRKDGQSRIYLSENNSYVLWKEINELNAAEQTDLYLYDRINNIVRNISDLDNSEGPVQDFSAAVDNYNDFHIFWSELNSASGEGYDIYHYSTATNSVETISDHLLTGAVYSPDEYGLKVRYSPEYIRLYATWTESLQNSNEGRDKFLWVFDNPAPVITPTTIPGQLVRTGSNITLVLGIISIFIISKLFRLDQRNSNLQ